MPSTVPASCGKRLAKNAGRSCDLAFANVPVDVLVEVFDENLAAELLAEEGHVRSDDRTEIEQPRLLTRRQAGEELGERFRRVDRRIRRAGVGGSVGVGFLAAAAEEIGKGHGRLAIHES